MRVNPESASASPHREPLRGHAGRTALLACAVLLFVALGRPAVAQDIETLPFFGINPSSDCQPARVPATPYERFDYHTLRRLACDVQAAFGDGNRAALQRALGDFRAWSRRYGETTDDALPWAEHAVAWRSVVLAALLVAADALDDRDARTQLVPHLHRHGAYLERPSIYRPNHNHGTNHALALMAMGVALGEGERAQRWRDLALVRIRQQLQGNVSRGGIHLEQSGFYHFYVLRSALEVRRLAAVSDAVVAPELDRRLAAMLEAATAMLSEEARIYGLPFTDPESNFPAAIVRAGRAIPAIREHRAFAGYSATVAEGRPREGMAVFPEGGYAFLVARDGAGSARVVFHTRILEAPHAHQDALGITVEHDGEPVVVFPSGMLPEGGTADWRSYFESPPAHNGVHVEGLAQRPLSRRKPGWIATFFDSWKVNRTMEALGVADAFTRMRRGLDLDRRTLRERAVPAGGEVLAKRAGGGWQSVTAAHATYPGVRHERSVVLLGTELVLVRDRLKADSPRTFVQRFHFPAGAKVALREEAGHVLSGDRRVASFTAVRSGAGQPDVCAGETRPQRCGWHWWPPEERGALPTALYRVRGTTAEFLWAMRLGAGAPPKLRALGSDDLCLGAADSGEYRLRFGRGTQLEVAPDDCMQ